MFRTIGDKTVVSSYEAPSKRKLQRQSELQKLTRNRFAEASRYAKSIMRDEKKYAYYKKRAKKLGVSSAYTAAITDYMRKGRVEHVDTSKFERKGQLTVMTYKKGLDFKSVRVRVVGAHGEDHGGGEAVKSGAGLWQYQHRGVRPVGSLRFVVAAEDMAGSVVNYEDLVLSIG